MLQKLNQVMQEGTIFITHAYLGHIKKDEERKVLDHAEAMPWAEVDPAVRMLLEQHLYQAIEGTLGEVNFPCTYTGDVLAVDKVASPEYDRTKNRPAVELLEAIRDMTDVQPDMLVDLGNVLAHKVMAAGAIKNHLVGVLKFHMIPSLGAQPIQFSFATVCDLDDKEESLFDEMKAKFVTQTLNNVVKKGHVSRAVFFPCLDDDGREMADMLVYAGSGNGAWFKTLEAGRRFSPRREGQALMRMITEQNTNEVPHDLFRKMGQELIDQAVDGLHAESVVQSLEKAVGHGVDRLGFLSRWEATFGGMDYKPRYEALFGGDGDLEKPTKLKMQAADISVTLTPSALERFRQVTVGDQNFIIFQVDDRAKVQVGKDLDLKIKPVELADLSKWLTGGEE